MTAARLVNSLLETDEVDPKDFIQSGNFDVPRVAQIRFSDMYAVHDPEDPIVHWAFLIWELERVGREPRRGLPQLGLNDQEWAYVNEKRDLFITPSSDANARGSAYITRYGLTQSAWERICSQLEVYRGAKGLHVVEVSANVPQFTQMPESVGTVSKLLEDDEFSLDDIKDYVAGQKISLANGIEFHIGFSIATSDEHMIEMNAQERGVVPNWDALNDAIARIERNAEQALNDVGINCRNEGHGSDGDLVGSAWVTGGTPGFEVVKRFIDMGEPFRTGSGTIGAIKAGLELSLYAGVPDDIAGLIDVDISFFDVEKIERVEDGGEIGESDERAEDPKEFVDYHWKFEDVFERTVHEIYPGAVISGIDNVTNQSHIPQYHVHLDIAQSQPRLWHEPLVKLITELEKKLTANYGWKIRPYRNVPTHAKVHGIKPINVAYSQSEKPGCFTLIITIDILRLDYADSGRFLVDPKWETPF